MNTQTVATINGHKAQNRFENQRQTNHKDKAMNPQPRI